MGRLRRLGRLGRFYDDFGDDYWGNDDYWKDYYDEDWWRQKDEWDKLPENDGDDDFGDYGDDNPTGHLGDNNPNENDPNKDKESDDRVRVPDGDCVIGVIAEALRMIGENYDLNEIKDFLKTQFSYEAGKGFHTGSISDLDKAMSNYFDTSIPSNSYQMNDALENGKMIYATVLGGTHAVLITGIDSDGKYIYYDPVNNHEGKFSSLATFNNWLIINGVKK